MQKFCGACNRVVYHAEQVNAAGGVYHIACFVCANAECGRRLDSRSCNQHANKLYCNFCYKNSFGPSGIGFGGLCIRKNEEHQKPVNAATNRLEDQINSVRFYGQQTGCHQSTIQQRKEPIYTPILRTWHH
ncbi:LIM zinc-binding domain-containing protein [Aphelenchoides bicaudatus]|nr:LIM zinc-binding domain-containing protein [Aphelenchoides bicaudatus]